VLKWIFERAEGMAGAVETPIGLVPGKDAIDISGLSGVADKMDEILRVDKAEWVDECDLIAEHQAIFGDRLPKEMADQFEGLKSRLKK
jgi:phosphoenolpyruvate carboxykinase (GTP)